jgi:hypothetical protein
MTVSSAATGATPAPRSFGAAGAADGDLSVCHRCGGRVACCLICGNRGVEPEDWERPVFVGEGPDADEFDS